MEHSGRALRWQVLGRDVRPATLFLSLNTGYVSLNAVLGRTVISGPQEAIIGALGLVAAIFMLVAWWAKSIRMMLWGLAGACWLWLTIAIAAANSTNNAFSVSAFGAFCWSGVAGGLWLRDSKEQPDEPGRK